MNGDLTSFSQPDSVWLFHGTTREAATGFAERGWDPPDPHATVRAIARAQGVDERQLLDSYTAWGKTRRDSGEMSCATGWRLAASYARNGAEYLFFARDALERHTLGESYRGTPSPQDQVVAVLGFLVPWSEMQDLVVEEVPVDRSALLPDDHAWERVDGLDLLERSAKEVVVSGRMMRPYLVFVDSVRPECGCEAHVILGRESPEDPRLRCSLCCLSSQGFSVDEDLSSSS